LRSKAKALQSNIFRFYWENHTWYSFQSSKEEKSPFSFAFAGLGLY